MSIEVQIVLEIMIQVVVSYFEFCLHIMTYSSPPPPPLPFSFSLPFHPISGLWTGLFVCGLLSSLVFIILLVKLDWKKITIEVKCTPWSSYTKRTWLTQHAE